MLNLQKIVVESSLNTYEGSLILDFRVVLLSGWFCL